MCGIVGTLALSGSRPPDPEQLRRMLGMIRHRGPDSFGVFVDDRVGLGSARLSIIDLGGGAQPIHNEDETIWIVYNGETYNYPELRESLERRGHVFYTNTDTEVIVHLYEERGASCVNDLNGQFAFALWNGRTNELVLARDRLGVRPLFYALAENTLIFGSEIKAVLADGRVPRELDPEALDQVFTLWAPLPGRSLFRGVHEVPPGHFLTVRDGNLDARKYWSLRFPQAGSRNTYDEHQRVVDFRDLLIDSVRLRLRADVPVGVYLSGGLDSSAIAAIVRQFTRRDLHTFSISFEDAQYSEVSYQELMVRHLGVEHHSIHCTSADIARVFPSVIWHSETPTLRTAPAPMFLLSQLVRDSGFKVVLTGEGADEFLAGYDIFKEDRIRRFWARNPASTLRPLLLQRLYADIPGLPRGERAFLEAFFRPGIAETNQKGYSHQIRWRNTARLKRLFSKDIQQQLETYDAVADLSRSLPDESLDWHPLSQAQNIEATTFLSQYLLSTQGDRMGMAHSVEGRFPFLDHRLVEHVNLVPPELKLRGLDEKYLLKQAVSDLVPGQIRDRVKRPYRAPIHRPFFEVGAPDYVSDLLSPGAISRAGLFNPTAVHRLVEKARGVSALSEMDSMAAVGVLSAQLLHHLFVDNFDSSGAGWLPELSVFEDHRREGSSRSKQMVSLSHR